MVHSNAPASAGTRRPTARTLLLATALLLALPVRAASPSAVTISPQAPNATVQGQSYAASAVTNPSLCPTAALDPQNTVCDHFQVTVATPAFDGLPLLEQHRRVNEALSAPLADGTIHELRIRTKGTA